MRLSSSYIIDFIFSVQLNWSSAKSFTLFRFVMVVTCVVFSKCQSSHCSARTCQIQVLNPWVWHIQGYGCSSLATGVSLVHCLVADWARRSLTALQWQACCELGLGTWRSSPRLLPWGKLACLPWERPFSQCETSLTTLAVGPTQSSVTNDWAIWMTSHGVIILQYKLVTSQCHTSSPHEVNEAS